MEERVENLSTDDSPNKEAIYWALKIYNASPLKQRKVRMLRRFMENPVGQRCLDLGSDNGVVSYLLREDGGEWTSADLEAETIESIRSLVGSRVEQVDGDTLPFADNYFDQVVIVDMLEHVKNDRQFIAETVRVLKPGGILLINVPNPKEGLLRALRFRLGQTDEAHGHLRPGYRLQDIEDLLPSDGVVEFSASYSRVFSELVDTFITFGVDLLKGAGKGSKGRVVTPDRLKKMQKSFRLYRLISPFMRIFVQLDELVPFLHGNMLLVRVRRR